ncbi:hypothetical protein LTR10_004420 [Elasticomyces elasticus]|nr:hypothetical protein LTR10_004420 [Elasticomyces elasticus]KAK4976738.1 hypothetical protein LTR42_002783 [Elasticomyces elasticus]
MSRRSSNSKSRRETIYEPLAPLPHQAKFPRRRKTVQGHGRALAPPLLTKRQSSLTQLEGWAVTPPSNSHEGDRKEVEEEENGEDEEYIEPSTKRRAEGKGKARGGRGSGSGSARRSSKRGLEKTDSQPTFTQAVRTNSSDVESASSAEEEEEEQPRAKTASTSKTKAKMKTKPKTTTKKLEKTDSQPTFTQALRTAPVQRTKRPAQQFRIYDDHDIAETPMERAAKRRKMRGGLPEVMDLVALHDSRYETKRGLRGESPEIAESSQAPILDSDEAIVLGKAESVRKLRGREVVSPARPTAAAREERRYPSLRLRKNDQAVVGERSPLKTRDANARSPIKQPRQAAKGKAEGRGRVVPGEESQVLAQQMLGVVGMQVVASSAIINDGGGESEGDEMARGMGKRRGLVRKSTILDSGSDEGVGSETESEAEDLEDSTSKPPALQIGQTVSIAESQVEHGSHADVEEAAEPDPDDDEGDTLEEKLNAEKAAMPAPKPRTSPRKLKREHTVQESQVDDFGVQDEDEWNDWDDEMGGGVTLSRDSIRLPEPRAQGRGLKRKGGALESEAEDVDVERTYGGSDGETVVQEAEEEEEEGLEGIGIVRGGDMPPPRPQVRASTLQRVGTVQESQQEDMDFEFDIRDEEDMRDDATTTENNANNEDLGRTEDEESGMPPPPPAPQQGRGRGKLKRVATVQDSQVDDLGEDLEKEWVAPLVQEETEAAVREENAVMLVEGSGEQAAMDEEDEIAVGGEEGGVVSEEMKDVPVENDRAHVVEEDDVFELEEDEAVVPEEEKAVAVEGEEFVDIDVLLADQERILDEGRGVGGEGVEGGVEADKPNEVRRGEGEVLQRRSQVGADDVDAGGLRIDLYEKSPAFVKAVNDAAELGSRHDASGASDRNEPAEAPEIEWYSTACERSSQRPASQLAEGGNGSGATVLSRDTVTDQDPRVGVVEIIDLQGEDMDANVSHERPATRPLESVELDVAKDDAMLPPSSGHLEQTTKPIEIIELTSDNEDDEKYDDEQYEDETMADLDPANSDNEDYYEGTYDPASVALDRDAARFAQRTQTQGWKQTQMSVYSHDLDEPAPVVRHRPFMTPGKVYKKTFDEPEEEWEDDEAGMQFEAELGEAVGGVVVSSQAAERNYHGVQMMVRDSQSAVVDVLRTGEVARDVPADDERVPSSPPPLHSLEKFAKPAQPVLQSQAKDAERVPSSPPAIRPSQVSTVGSTQLSSIRPGSRNGPSTETQWSVHSPPKFTQSRWQHQEETLSSSPLALPPWTSPERRRFADMGMGKGKGKQTVMGSMGGYSLGELEDFSLPPPPPISSSRAGTQSGRSSSPVVR